MSSWKGADPPPPSQSPAPAPAPAKKKSTTAAQSADYSKGMKQSVALALALALEPTTTVQNPYKKQNQSGQSIATTFGEIEIPLSSKHYSFYV